MAIGDSSALARGDSVRMFGHPGLDPSGAITPQAVMVTSASVTGVRGAPAAGDRAWLKTDARLPHGSGGGPVFGADGELIGITSQIAYSSSAPVAYVRPIELAASLIERARQLVEVDSPNAAPLLFGGPVPGTALPSPGDGVAISQPRFALEALDEGGERELFGYGQVFPPQTNELHYEFVAQGVPNGATVQELWYLDGIFQDELSATYNWELGPLALITDELISPNPVGIPNGVWTLEVWTDGTLRATARAYLGVEPPLPSANGLSFGNAVSQTFGPLAVPAEGDERTLAFFDYSGAGAAQVMSWRVFRGGSLTYESPEVPWLGGNSGTWWIGWLPPGGLGLGAWEFELLIDGEPVANNGFEVTASGE